MGEHSLKAEQSERRRVRPGLVSTLSGSLGVEKFPLSDAALLSLALLPERSQEGFSFLMLARFYPRYI